MRFNFISFIPVTNEKVLIMIYNGIKRIIRRVGSRLILLTLKLKKNVIGSLTRELPSLEYYMKVQSMKVKQNVLLVLRI